ncbi:MAG: phenylalanine--tRNA ligase subunit alpha [Anaerolineales bacterium]|jgi:phenylalanyl-tRNA synthetase alpha chain
MLKALDEIQAQALKALEAAKDEEQLLAWRQTFLSRSAELSQIVTSIPDLKPEERPQVGRKANEVKTTLESELARQRAAVQAAALDRKLRQEALDVTLPGRPMVRGRLHPSTQNLRMILDIWREMGFQIYTSREVETEDHNFELLNMPAHHPARDMWDTFYTTTPGVLLRTHTSPGQIRIMRERSPDPIRVVLPGMCYRYEQITTRSEVQFNQIEGLAVGKHITMTDLKGTLNGFARHMFGDGVKTRFRASHFPFTEPSGELDIECFVCMGEGCSVCKHTGWLEILGCGMVHPTVLLNGGYDPEIFSGFAFGMGPERIKMLMHRLDDIRLFWANDMRFLEQF